MNLSKRSGKSILLESWGAWWCTSQCHYHCALFPATCIISWQSSLARAGQISLALHTLQLCAQNAETATRRFHSLCTKARLFVGHSRHGSRARAQLHMMQRSMETKALQPSYSGCPSQMKQWVIMLPLLLEIKPITAARLTAIDARLTLSAAEWCRVSVYMLIFKPLSEVTALACSATYPTPSEVIPLLHSVLTLLEKAVDRSETDTIMSARSLVKSLCANSTWESFE